MPWRIQEYQYMTILLLDDDATLRTTLADFLHKKGHRTVQAATVSQALETVQQYPVRVVVATQKTPDIDGIALCHAIRNIRKEAYIFFILLAQTDEKEKKLAGLKQGIDSYLSKPVDFHELDALIQVGKRISEFKPQTQTQSAPPLPQPEISPIPLALEARKETTIKKEDIGEYDILLARIALELKLITKEQLAKAFSIQKKEGLANRKLSLGDIFLETAMISQDKMATLHQFAKQRLEKKFGIFVLRKGLATQAQVDLALEEQVKEFKATQSCRLTGDILVAQGVITKEQRDLIRLEINGVKPDVPVLKPQSPPEDAMFQIRISDDRLEARIHPKKEASGRITPEDILETLSRKGIRFGIADMNALTGYVNSDFSQNPWFVAARGKPPAPGCDASICYHFDTDHLTAGTLNEDGSINYKERGTIPRVKTGDLLATKIPMQESLPGIDIYANPIPASAVADIEFKCGEGARMSEEGLNVYATTDGQPTLAVGGTLSVYAELTIDGDVGFNTGNIDFDGNVNIKGALLNGFSVKCGNLTVKEIVDGHITAIGDVTVSGGIIRGDIKAEGTVKAKFITDSNIKSFGCVIVDKEVINTKIRSSGKFLSERGKIISSFISAKMGFESREIGTDISRPCRINVGLDENVKKRIQALNYMIDDKKKILETAQKRYEKDVRTSSRNPDIPDEKDSEDLAIIEAAIKEIETISEEKQAIIKWSKDEKGIPVVKVKGQIWNGTALFGIHSCLTLMERVKNVTITEIKHPETDFWYMAITESKA